MHQFLLGFFAQLKSDKKNREQSLTKPDRVTIMYTINNSYFSFGAWAATGVSYLGRDVHLLINVVHLILVALCLRLVYKLPV